MGSIFEGIENFRDFGGVSSALGGHVRAGRLFRAGHLGAATPADIAALEQLGIATVVDLRRPTERAHQPSQWTAFAGRRIVSDAGDRAEGPHVEFLHAGDLSDAGVDAYLTGYYRRAPFEPRHLALFADAFAALDPDTGEAGAILIHCAAGKDRTGLLAALILAALGVAPTDVMADFVQTNAAMMTPERRRAVSANLQSIIGRPPSEAILLGFMGVTAAHLDIALDAINARAGSLDAYLATLGVDAARRQRLRASLLD